jgi:hypothetical protein
MQLLQHHLPNYSLSLVQIFQNSFKFNGKSQPLMLVGKSNRIIRLCHALSIFVLWELHDIPYTLIKHLYTKKTPETGQSWQCPWTSGMLFPDNAVYTMKHPPTKEREYIYNIYNDIYIYIITWWKSKTSYGLGLKWWNFDRAKLWEISISRQSVAPQKLLRSRFSVHAVAEAEKRRVAKEVAESPTGPDKQHLRHNMTYCSSLD